MVSSTRCDMWYVQFIQKIHVFSSSSRPCFLLPLLLFFLLFFFSNFLAVFVVIALFSSDFWEATFERVLEDATISTRWLSFSIELFFLSYGASVYVNVVLIV